MTMSTTINLNLARKWRSKSFDQIIGQTLSVRMLKNSLYLESYFPVYLFSGQRGCGKTTTARVFACAINCERLTDFQKNPRSQSIPCLECFSCQAMLAGKHPDFIEIDAASHTGVDNVRQIVDAASLLPVMGRKKIYLIDEAHMLSKAAFNAFLKILEEPPMSVLFILATTDPQKIIDTVKSRCFQLFFGAVDASYLSEHLINICKTERINYEPAGLSLIIKVTDGSVRDAINLLEQVRFATNSVSKQAVLSVLGHIDDERLLVLFKTALTLNPAQLLQYINTTKLSMYSAEFIWHKLVELGRATLWLKHGVEPDQFGDQISQLKHIARACSFAQLNGLLEVFYTHESLFLKTTAQHSLLEMILLKIAQKNNPDDNSGAPCVPQSITAIGDADDVPTHEDLENEEDEDSDDEDEDEQEDDVEHKSFLRLWQHFAIEVENLQDPLLNSVFKQGSFVQYNESTKTLDVEFSKEMSFFKDWLADTHKLWLPILHKVFEQDVIFNPLFNSVAKAQPTKLLAAMPVINKEVKPVEHSNPVYNKPAQATDGYTKKQAFVPKQYALNSAKKYNKIESRNPLIDVSDANTWKKTNLILRYFPSVVREIKEISYEQKA